jgi:hypothetical protein
MLGGSKWVTSSGRRIAVPVIIVGKQRITTCIRMMDSWLLQEVFLEAEARGEEHIKTLFGGEKPGKLPPASRDALNDYLFDGVVEVK